MTARPTDTPHGMIYIYLFNYLLFLLNRSGYIKDYGILSLVKDEFIFYLFIYFLFIYFFIYLFFKFIYLLFN